MYHPLRTNAMQDIMMVHLNTLRKTLARMLLLLLPFRPRMEDVFSSSSNL